jgi:hypothetical protein
MGPAVDKITLQEYTDAIRRYYKSGHGSHLRMGQYLCNCFNIFMDENDERDIFYEDDERKAMELFAKYVKCPE